MFTKEIFKITKNYMEFIKETIQRKKSKLYEWMDRYEKEDYPYKIIQNLFYDLYATKVCW